MSGEFTMGALVTPTKRCEETRAHYAHEWYNPLRQHCPGGPDETEREAWREAVQDAYMKGRLAGPPDPNKASAPDDLDELKRRRADLPTPDPARTQEAAASAAAEGSGA